MGRSLLLFFRLCDSFCVRLSRRVVGLHLVLAQFLRIAARRLAVGKRYLAIPVCLGDRKIVCILRSRVVKCDDFVVDLPAALFRSFAAESSLFATSVEAFCSAVSTSLATVSGGFALLQAARQSAIIIAEANRNRIMILP